MPPNTGKLQESWRAWLGHLARVNGFADLDGDLVRLRRLYRSASNRDRISAQSQHMYAFAHLLPVYSAVRLTVVHLFERLAGSHFTYSV
jgi:hypothetical protein